MASGQFSKMRGRAVRTPGALALLGALIISGAGLCGPLPSASLAAEARAAAEPVVVTARTLTADNKKHIVVYRDDVVVKRGDVTMHADNVTIRLSPADKKPGGDGVIQAGGGVDTIEAAGRVRILQGGRTATADKAVFYNTEDRIVLTGSPRVWEGGNVLTGTKVTYDMKEDTFTVEDAKTTLYPEGAEGKTR